MLCLFKDDLSSVSAVAGLVLDPCGVDTWSPHVLWLGWGSSPLSGEDVRLESAGEARRLLEMVALCHAVQLSASRRAPDASLSAASVLDRAVNINHELNCHNMLTRPCPLRSSVFQSRFLPWNTRTHLCPQLRGPGSRRPTRPHPGAGAGVQERGSQSSQGRAPGQLDQFRV